MTDYSTEPALKSITVTLTPPAGIVDEFEIQISSVNEPDVILSNKTIPNNGNTINVPFDDLNPGTEYIFEVVSKSNTKLSPPSQFTESTSMNLTSFKIQFFFTLYLLRWNG